MRTPMAVEFRAGGRSLAFAILLGALAGCGPASTGGGMSSGGALGTGGAPSTSSGGAPGGASGGSTGTTGSGGGVTPGSGGQVGAGTGGAASAGSSGSANGGSDGAGPGGSGGAPRTGGMSGTGTGGRTGGNTGSGGTPATGGAAMTGGRGGGSAATGGAPSTGGAPGSGGAPGTGGAPAVTGRIYYVTPTGKSSNDGKSYVTAMDFATAHAAVVAGDAIYMQPGTYAIAYQSGAKNTITISKAGTAAKPMLVLGDGGRAVFDFSFPEQQWVQDGVGFMLTGSYWTFRNLDITRAGYQGVYVTGQHNTFENCTFHDNRNTGLEINEGGGYTTVINCDAYRNYDPKKFGGMADGFGPKQTQGPGNKFIGCRAWENSDDGYDAFDSPQNVTFENCWAFRNGVDVWNYGGFDGNGNGFKLGGNAAQANPKVTNCVSFDNRVKGFDQNNNTGGITIYNSTGYNNGTNFGLGGTLASGQKHDLKNNISVGSMSADAYGSGSTQSNNSWQSGLSAAASDFASTDTSLAKAARAADGTLPMNNLFRLKTGSKLIDAGVNVGLPFKGSAPDLGAFEF